MARDRNVRAMRKRCELMLRKRMAVGRCHVRGPLALLPSSTIYTYQSRLDCTEYGVLYCTDHPIASIFATNTNNSLLQFMRITLCPPYINQWYASESVNVLHNQWKQKEIQSKPKHQSIEIIPVFSGSTTNLIKPSCVGEL